MPTFTPVYALPKPALSESPNGPVQIGALADATEAAITTAAAATAAGAPRLIKMQRYTSGSNLGTATVTGTNVQIMTTGSVNYVAGRIYQVEFGVNYDANTGVFGNGVNDTHVLEIKDTNISGTTMFADMFKQNGSPAVPLWTKAVFQYTPGSNITKTFIACITRISGSGTLSARPATSGSTYTAVIDMGPTSLSTNI